MNFRAALNNGKLTAKGTILIINVLFMINTVFVFFKYPGI